MRLSPVASVRSAPSRALVDWRSERALRLDRLQAAHTALTRPGPGRRWVTEEVNHALIVRLASEFQGFVRDLHDEAVDAVVAALPGLSVNHASALRASLQKGRRVDAGNATWGNVVTDFGVFGMSLSAAMRSRYPARYGRWVEGLEAMNASRNAIAHQDPVRLAEATAAYGLTLATFKGWRGTMNAVASGTDQVVRRYLVSLNGVDPW